MDPSYFGLSESAFSLRPSAKPFFINDGYREAFIALRYGIQLRLGVIVLTGESGVGKTSLICLLKESCDSRVRLTVVSPRVHGNSIALPEVLGLDVPKGKRAKSQALKAYLTEQFERGQIIALIVDDAHELSSESFRDLQPLTRLQSNGQSLLQIILVGRPELAFTLDDAALRPLKQRARLWSRIMPLPPDEVKAYIDHRLASAGNRLPGLFDSAAVDRIAAYTNGIPGRINTLCERSLTTAHSRSLDHVTAAIVEDAWRILCQTGETDFEVAALLSEIKLLGQSSSEAHTKGQSPQEFEETSDSQNAARSDHRPHVWMILHRLQRAANFLGNMVLAPAHRLKSFASRSRQWSRTPRPYQITAAFIAICTLAVLSLRLSNHSAEQHGRPQVQSQIESELKGQSETVSEPGDLNLVQSGGNEPLRSAPLSRPQPELVYIHTSQPGDFPVLEGIRDVLRTDGYNVPQTRLTRNKTLGDVRFFFGRDRHTAERVKAVVEMELQRRGYSHQLQLLERDGKRFQFASPGKIEVWLPPLGS